MPLSWIEVEQGRLYKELSETEKELARQQYFKDVVAPKVPLSDRELALQQFISDTSTTPQQAPVVPPRTAGAPPSHTAGATGSFAPLPSALEEFPLPLPGGETSGRLQAGMAGVAREVVKGITLGNIDLYESMPVLKELEDKYLQPNIPINPKDPIIEKVRKKFMRDPAIIAKVPARILGELLTIGKISKTISAINGIPETISIATEYAARTGGIVGMLRKPEREGFAERVKSGVVHAAFFATTTALILGANKIIQNYRVGKLKTIQELREAMYRHFIDDKGLSRNQDTIRWTDNLLDDLAESRGGLEKMSSPQIRAALRRVKAASVPDIGEPTLAPTEPPASPLPMLPPPPTTPVTSPLPPTLPTQPAAPVVPPAAAVNTAEAQGTSAWDYILGKIKDFNASLGEKGEVDIKKLNKLIKEIRDTDLSPDAKELALAAVDKSINIPTKAIPSTATAIPPKPPLTGKGSGIKGKPPDVPIGSSAINQDYELLKDAWFAEKDWQTQKANVESARLQDQIKATTGEKKHGQLSRDFDKAIQINIDLKRKPEHLEKFYGKLTPKQKHIVSLSQKLSPEQQDIADDISQQYEAVGLQAQDAEVIHNTIDNYVGRIWDVKQPKRAAEAGRKFGTTTRHAKARKFETILEGWANGYELKVEGATNNLSILKEEIHNTIQDKKFLDQLTKLKDLDGNSIVSPRQLEGYRRIEHPNFKAWRFAGKTEPADLRGRNFLQTPEGTILERKELYAPKEIAHDLNNIMGVSKLKGIPAIDAITKYNAITKSWILQSSLFHHLAFMRSYYLGSASFGEAASKIKAGEEFVDTVSQLTPRQAYQSGQKAIKDLTPEVELLVRNGLTIGKIQDWEESVLRNEDTFVGRMMDKYGATKEIKDKINLFRQNQTDFLFKQFGAGLKAKAALIELRSILRKYPGIDPNEAAKIVANLMNDDFGGLHLKRMGRNPTVQHVFKIFALAPDWTESNIRSAVKAFKTGTEGEVYRRFWARIITKAMLATLAANALLHSKKEKPEVYGKAWKAGKLRWLDVDITPIYRAVGGNTDRRKYFSIIGHFKDPLKFALYPIKAAHYKGSPVYQSIFEAITGEDWAGREFTEAPELLKTGATVRPWWTFVGRPNKYSQMPSYLLNQAKGIQPIQVQQLLNWWAGETEGFDAIGQSLGLGIRSTYEPIPEQKAREKALRKAIKKLHPKEK